MGVSKIKVNGRHLFKKSGRLLIPQHPNSKTHEEEEKCPLQKRVFSPYETDGGVREGRQDARAPVQSGKHFSDPVMDAFEG
jgi:hypothetical protein